MAPNVLEHAILSVHVGLTDLSRRCTLLSDIVFGRVRPPPIRFPRGAFPHRSGCGETFSSGNNWHSSRSGKVKPRRADDSSRWMMATLSGMFPWRDALVNVKPDTLLRWHRKGFRLF